MKKSITLFFVLAGLSATATSAATGEARYIPWTFDDFDNDCEVIRKAEKQPLAVSTVTNEIRAADQVGELGW